MMHTANPHNNPVMGDTCQEKHIPAEAALVHKKQVELLQKSNNLTITFDGGLTCKLQSVYTVHVTTPLRDVFFIEREEGTDTKHTTDYLSTMLLRVCEHFKFSEFVALL